MENSAEEGETAPAKPAEDEVAHEVVEKDQSAEEVEEEENENKSSIATNNEVASSSKGSIFYKCFRTFNDHLQLYMQIMFLLGR